MRIQRQNKILVILIVSHHGDGTSDELTTLSINKI